MHVWVKYFASRKLGVNYYFLFFFFFFFIAFFRLEDGMYIHREDSFSLFDLKEVKIEEK